MEMEMEKEQYVFETTVRIYVDACDEDEAYQKACDTTAGFFDSIGADDDDINIVIDDVIFVE